MNQGDALNLILKMRQDRWSHRKKALEVSKFQTIENMTMEHKYTLKLGVVEPTCSPTVFWRLKQEDCGFEGGLDCAVRPYLRKNAH